MKEIKFRAWDKEDKKMIYPQFLLQDDDGCIFGDGEVAIHKDWIWEDMDYLEIMQFTGLKDKNGKEIYEGDIVQNSEGLIGQELHYIFTVIFMHGNYILESEEDHEYNDYLGAVEPLEIIGNIYENPDLANNN